MVIYKQPNGKLMVWSRIVDNALVYNATADEIAGFYADIEIERIRERIRRRVAELEDWSPEAIAFAWGEHVDAALERAAVEAAIGGDFDVDWIEAGETEVDA